MRRLGSVLLAAALLLTVAPSGVGATRRAPPPPPPPPPAPPDSTPIMGRSVLIADQLAAWFASTGRSDRLDGLSVGQLARLFVEEGAKEGVRGELAFAQTIFETGFFQFSERFPPECHNYAGIGGTQTRHCFDTARLGVRAQIQHLRAYADPTVDETGTASTLVDPRFHLVSPKGVAPTVEDLSGRWAPGEDYGEKIVRIYRQIRDHAGPTLRDRPLGARIVGAASPSGSGGLYLVDAAGGVFTLGGVPFHGSIPGLRNAGQRIGEATIVGIAAAPDGDGYWLVDDKGGVFTFGSASFHGSIPRMRLDGHRIGEATIVGIAAAPDGDGYWLVDDKGGVFTFGSASFHGSIPRMRLDGHRIGRVDVTTIAAAPDGDGYWLVDAIGGVFPFGSADFHGSIPGLRQAGHDIGHARVVGLVPFAGTDGYWLVDSAGGTFQFGAAPFRGSAAEADLDMVGAILSADGAGHRIISDDGAVITYT